MANILLITLFFIFSTITTTTTYARKSPKEWASFNSNQKLYQLGKEADKELEELGDVAPEAKPGLIFAYFKAGFLKQKDSNKFGQKWASQLSTEGIKSSVYEAGEDTWVIATHRKQDAYTVLGYLMDQPEVMRTTFENSDRWNLPRYQTEYDAYLAKRAEAKKTQDQANAPPPLTPEEMAKRKEEATQAIKKMQEQLKNEENVLDVPMPVREEV